MPISKDKLIKSIMDGFQSNKGKASFYCFNTDVIPEIIYNVVHSVLAKRPEADIFICVDSYDTRVTILNYLKNNGYNPNQSKIRVLSTTYVKPCYVYNYCLTITVGINSDFTLINNLANEAKFMLCILTKNIMDNNFIINVRNILPNIITADSDIAIRNDYINSPVEEHLVDVDLSDEDTNAYDKFTEYINTSISIFGELSNIEKCKKGDKVLGISATQFRENIARENGWNENLDVNIPFMKQIDDIYNPNILFERACTFYTIAGNRRQLLTDNKNKLNVILDICKNNIDKRIVIVSKRGEFAAKITEYLNNNGLKCGNYHDCIADIPATDDNGNVIFIKSGNKAGKIRYLGWQAQSSLSEKLFNYGNINILSIKSAANPKLKIACDIIIFTSPLYDNPIDFKRRFINVNVTGIPNKVYMIYCNNTIEYDKIVKTPPTSIVKMIFDNKNDDVIYDENSGNIII